MLLRMTPKMLLLSRPSKSAKDQTRLVESIAHTVLLELAFLHSYRRSYPNLLRL